MSKLKMKELVRKIETQSIAHEQLIDAHIDLNARINELKTLLWNHEELEEVEIKDWEIIEAFNTYNH